MVTTHEESRDEMNIPDDVRYTPEHEWVRPLAAGTVRVGITEYAQDQLGDIVFVDLPTVGDAVEAGALISEVESTKSVGEVYAPVSGTISAVNDAVRDRPELVNEDPYGTGWLVELESADPLDALLDASAYRSLIE